MGIKGELLFASFIWEGSGGRRGGASGVRETSTVQIESKRIHCFA